MTCACRTTSTQGPNEAQEVAIRRVAAALLAICKILVDNPNQVMVTWSCNGEVRIVNFEVQAHPDDLKFLIGRFGDTAEAIRDLLFAASGRIHASMRLQICD